VVNPNGSTSRKRFHIVLIPGFGGFDALGGVEYYAGTTNQFQAWKSDNPDKPAVLHYFDNLPTAAVVTRAAELKNYLATRIARGEISKDDDVVLVGHSTGGLDIRQLVSDLHHLHRHGDHPPHVDGGVEVKPGEILDSLHRVVFLSVPHWGTNIADWVHSNPLLRQAVVRYLQAAVTGSQVYLLDELEEQIAGSAASLTGADLLLAMQDSLTEANEDFGKKSPLRTAEAHQTASDLALYLHDMASDFHAINDLTSEPPADGPASPAHFNNAERKKELKLWNDRHIATLSYATVGTRPFHFVSGSPAPVFYVANPFSYPEILKEDDLSAGTDISYRFCYRACAGGPFRQPNMGAKITRHLNGTTRDPIELWDNDGIVNTASMLWPKGENVLVSGDHLDIVGHYKLVKADPGGGRRYRSYDSLNSASGFDSNTFTAVWREIFDFCVGQ